MIKICFLDIDGTLNDNGWQNDEFEPWITHTCAKNFSKIIQATGAKVVLISQRRAALHGGRISLAGFQLLLRSHGIKCHVIDFVPYDKDCQQKRWLVTEWLNNNECDRYVILDDMHLSLSYQVKPDGNVGLTEQDVEKAISILNRP